MAGFRSLTPSININTASGQLRTELLNTFSRLDGQLALAPYRLATLASQSSSSGSGETTIASYTVDVGTLAKNNSSMLIFACGQTAANGNNKTLKLKLGSTTLFTSGAIASNNKDWTLQAEIVRTGAATETAWTQYNINGSAPIVTTTTATENLATSLTLSITGQGTSSGDISIFYYKILLLT